MAADAHVFGPGRGYLICYGAVLLAVTFGFAVISFDTSAVAPEDRAAWVPYLFWIWMPIAAVLAYQFWRLAIRREPVLRIDRDGFALDIVFAAVGRIEWIEVERAFRLTQRHRDRIEITTRDPNLPGRRRSALGRLLTWGEGGPGPIQITKSMVDNRLDEVQKLIVEYAGTGITER